MLLGRLHGKHHQLALWQHGGIGQGHRSKWCNPNGVLKRVLYEKRFCFCYRTVIESECVLLSDGASCKKQAKQRMWYQCYVELGSMR